MNVVFNEIDAEPVDVNGSSVSILNDFAFVIGGKFSQSNYDPAYLSIRQIALTTATWMPELVNTTGIPNRMYHTSSAICGKIVVLGGCSTANMQCVFNNAVEISRSDFGYQSIADLEDPALCRFGHSASVIGSNRDRIVIFGGSSNSSGDLIMISYHDIPKCETLSIQGESPHTRSFHSATVCGDSNQHIIVFGGKHESKVFGDLWILDLSAVLQAGEAPAEVVDPKAKGGKKGGGAVSAPVGIWMKLAESIACPPRYFHSSFVYLDRMSRSRKFCVFGGAIASKTDTIPFWEATLSVTDGPVSIGSFEGRIVEEKLIDPPTDDSNSDAISESIYGQVSAVVAEETSSAYAIDSASFLLRIGGFSRGSNTVSTKLSKYQSTSILVLNDKSTRAFELLDFVRRRKAKVAYVDPSDPIPTRFEYANGDVYEGAMAAKDQSNDMDSCRYWRHGYGSLTYATTGDVFEGNWVQDIRQGAGKLTCADGHYFEGEMSEDMYCYGLLRSPDGTEYQGPFQANLYEGAGRLQRPNGEIYEGEFTAGRVHGAGRLTGIMSSILQVRGFVATDSYIDGTWTDEKLDIGYANRLLIDGWGRWGDNLSYSAESGFLGIYTGKLLRALPSDDGATCNFSNGGSYSGSYKTGRRNGLGIYVYPNLDEYEGKWVANKRCGFGVWKSKKGEKYEGLWDSDKPHGTGIMTMSNGSLIQGTWREGIRHEALPHGKEGGE